MDLQKQLLKDIQYGSWMGIYNTDVGTCKIEELLCRRRTLLVLDGINKFEQLDVLIGTHNLHPGSRIIITSKSEFLTEECGLFQTKVIPLMHTKLLLEGLDVKESLQLLSWHAFGHDEPKEDDKKDSMKIISYCRGHPLALKVLGSSLRNDGVTWKDIGESLGEEMNTDIQKVLKISFDSLPYEKDKELFKHIACFFVREDKKFTEDILKACGICKSSGVNILINRCLLTVGSSNKLEMHQLLQDMGRDIVRQENPDKPWKRSLLWHYKECLDVLQNRKGTTKIQGFVLDMKTETSRRSSSVDDYNNFRSFPFVDWVLSFCTPSDNQQVVFETLAFSEMCNLRLLQLNYVQISGSYKNFPKGLRWLCMHGFPLSFIPSDLQMENMVALDMSNSNLQQLWKKPKLLKSLKFLNLSGCYQLGNLGHFSAFPLLESLILAGCASLVEVSESIGNCDRHVVLNMSECHQLKKLPGSIRNLKNLKKLMINGCSNLGEFPVEMKDMESLEVLEANSINMKSQVSSSAIVEAMPRRVKSFVSSLPSSLVTLSLKNSNLSNESFPVDFIGLSMLRVLYLDENPIDSLPDCVRSLRGLVYLSLNNCKTLKTILDAPNTIFMLEMDACQALEKVTFYPEESVAPRVKHQELDSLTEVQDKFKMQAISEIDEAILHSLGWIDIECVNYRRFFITTYDGMYYPGNIRPAQMLYEHGIFSTYLNGQEVPKSFTHRSNGSSVTLKSNKKNCRIRGLNVCIASTISDRGKDPLRISIRNLTKNCSWIYQPMTYIWSPNEVILWLSHWMFENNEFEDGDEVNVHVSSKVRYCTFYDYNIRSDEREYAHVREYGISLMYCDENKKEDPLACYKSWTHIITRDISAAKLYSSDYLLKPYWPLLDYKVYPQAPYWPN